MNCPRCTCDVDTYDDTVGGQATTSCARCHKVLRRGACARINPCPFRAAATELGIARVTEEAGYTDDFHPTTEDLPRIMGSQPKSNAGRESKRNR